MSLMVGVFVGAHDSAVAVANASEVLLSLEAERVFRRRYARATRDEMEQLIATALEFVRESGVDGSEGVDEILVSRWLSPFGRTIPVDGRERKYRSTGHHDNHIGALVPLFDDCSGWIAVVADGGSEDGCSAAYRVQRANDILLVDRIESLDPTPLTGRVFGSLAQVIVTPDWWSAHLQGAGKLMGLAAHGEFAGDVAEWLAHSWQRLDSLRLEDADELRRILRVDPSDLNARACDVAFTAVEWWMSEAERVFRDLAHGGAPIGFVGGCAQNVVLVGRLRTLGLDVRVPPAANDSGQALGALLRSTPSLRCRYPYLGRGQQRSIDAERAGVRLADDLAEGRVVGWIEGRAEVGPRALGHRSILALPSSIGMRRRVSEHVKNREPYRPLAAMVLREDVSQYFHCDWNEPYMTAAYQARSLTRNAAPAVVHIDGSSRVQTVADDASPTLACTLRELLNRGLPPILINTSLNGAGQPIAESVGDIADLIRPGMLDCCYVNGVRSS